MASSSKSTSVVSDAGELLVSASAPSIPDDVPAPPVPAPLEAVIVVVVVVICFDATRGSGDRRVIADRIVSILFCRVSISSSVWRSSHSLTRSLLNCSYVCGGGARRALYCSAMTSTPVSDGDGDDDNGSSGGGPLLSVSPSSSCPTRKTGVLAYVRRDSRDAEEEVDDEDFRGEWRSSSADREGDADGDSGDTPSLLVVFVVVVRWANSGMALHGDRDLSHPSRGDFSMGRGKLLFVT